MPAPPEFFVFFGLIATGKSTLAKAWAAKRGLAYFNSDVVRKELAGLAPTASRAEAMDQGIYSPEFSRRTYQALLARAEETLRQGKGVVLDASYQSAVERQKVRQLAARLGAQVIFVWCQCDDTVKKERLARRALDPAAVSDGRWEILERQKQRFEPPDELAAGQLVPLDTTGSPAETLDRLERILATGEIPPPA